MDYIQKLKKLREQRSKIDSEIHGLESELRSVLGVVPTMKEESHIPVNQLKIRIEALELEKAINRDVVVEKKTFMQGNRKVNQDTEWIGGKPEFWSEDTFTKI